MPDPLVLVCPSDAANVLRDTDNPACINVPGAYECEGSGRTAPAGHDTQPQGTEIGLMSFAGNSYNYLGYVFDKLERTQTLGQCTTCPIDDDNIIPISTVLMSFGGTTDLSTVPAPTQSVQVFEHIWNQLLFNCTEATVTPARVSCGNNVADKDHSPIVDPDDDSLPYGTGDGDTIYRLREGIERFMITDINNPGASARAQSSIFIMWDDTSTQATGFNHVPGGSNVLYLDGHVEFIRYPGPEDSPLNKGFAQFSGSLASLG
jgi:prepilin-type processing-associated H-X9-DG protein